MNKTNIGIATGAFLLTGISAYLLYKRFKQSDPLVMLDPYFKTENIALYSTEAEKRAD